MAAEEISLEDLQTDEDIQPVVKSHISKGALTRKKNVSVDDSIVVLIKHLELTRSGNLE